MEPVGGGREFGVAAEARRIAASANGMRILAAVVGAKPEPVEAVDPLAEGEMVAIGGDSAQIDTVGARDDRRPFARPGRVGLGEAEVDVIVVGDDPQPAVRGVDRIFALLAARRDQGERRPGIVGGDEADLAGRIVAGGDEDQAPVLRARDADAESPAPPSPRRA